MTPSSPKANKSTYVSPPHIVRFEHLISCAQDILAVGGEGPFGSAATSATYYTSMQIRWGCERFSKLGKYSMKRMHVHGMQCSRYLARAKVLPLIALSTDEHFIPPNSASKKCDAHSPMEIPAGTP